MTDKHRYIIIGKVGAAHGVHGWVKITSYTDTPADIFSYQPWHLQQNGKWEKATFTETRQQDQYLAARINSCEDRDSAQRLTNLDIAINRNQLPKVAEDEYYWSDLEGLSVKTENNVYLGTVDHLFETGANDIMVVIDKNSGPGAEKRCLLPFIKKRVIKKVDFDQQEIIVDWDPEF